MFEKEEIRLTEMKNLILGINSWLTANETSLEKKSVNWREAGTVTLLM